MSERDPRRPEFCECGGKLNYDELLGVTFSWCERCTSVVTVKLPHAEVIRRAEETSTEDAR